MSMTALGNASKTDKGTISGNKHAYTCVYDLLFAGMRNSPIDLLEIGLNLGGPEHGFDADRVALDVPSVKLWHGYFPNAHVHGVDISDFSAYTDENFTFHRADCGDPDALDRVARLAPRCDVVIDDGSHASYHQQLTMLKLFPLVKPGGFYIIEDLDWQPLSYERALPRVPKTRYLLHHFVKNGRLSDTGAFSAAEWRAVTEAVENIMLVNTSKLIEMGNFYNQNTHNSRAEYSRIVDRKVTSMGHLKAIFDRLVDLASFSVQRQGPSRDPVRLAIIQKRWN
jgi:hypothetical protein